MPAWRASKFCAPFWLRNFFPSFFKLIFIVTFLKLWHLHAFQSRNSFNIKRTKAIIFWFYSSSCKKRCFKKFMSFHIERRYWIRLMSLTWITFFLWYFVGWNEHEKSQPRFLKIAKSEKSGDLCLLGTLIFFSNKRMFSLIDLYFKYYFSNIFK